MPNSNAHTQPVLQNKIKNPACHFQFFVKNAVWRRLPGRLSQNHPSSGDKYLLLGRKNLVRIDARPIHVQCGFDRLPCRPWR